MTLTNYWWLLIWMFTGGLVISYVTQRQEVNVLGRAELRWSMAGAIAVVIPYVIWAGFRSNGFGDTGSYRRMFLEVPSSITEWSGYLEGVTKDKGFSVLTLILKFIIGNSSVLFFILIAAFQILCVAFVYRKYSEDYWLSLFLFIASTDYMSWIHNGVRQFMAVTIIFAATGLILKKKYVPLIFVILMAFTMHGSALLMLPIVFILQGQAWNKKTLLCVAASVAALVFVDQFTNILDILLSDTQYTNVVSDWQMWEDDGTNPIRVLVYSLPTILSLVGYRYIKEENDSVINMAVNASIVSTALYIVSMGTSGIFMGRLPIYTSLYATGILLPWEINHMFTKESAVLVKLAAVIGYAGFFYYQMHFVWGLI